MSKLSAVIITFNEENNIARCLDSIVNVVDEIIIIDSLSTDRTEAICSNYNVKFIKREWEGYSATKNFANSLVTSDYILSLDADEALSPELTASILQAKKAGFTGVYELVRLTNYCGKWIYNSGWYPDVKIRVFPTEFSKWDGEIVHENLVFSKEQAVTRLNGDLYHYSYVSFIDHKNRADQYSRLTAIKYAQKGKKANLISPYFSALARFVSMFVFKKGFLDGYMGYKIAAISAASNIYKYQEVRRINRENSKNK